MLVFALGPQIAKITVRMHKWLVKMEKALTLYNKIILRQSPHLQTFITLCS